MNVPQFKVDPRTYVPLDSICLIESASNYTIVHLRDGSQALSCRTIGYLFAQLPHLVRVHRAYAVRADQVEGLKRTLSSRGQKGWQIQLKSGKTVPVGQSHTRHVEQCFTTLLSYNPKHDVS